MKYSDQHRIRKIYEKAVEIGILLLMLFLRNCLF